LAYTFNLLRNQEEYNFIKHFSSEDISYFRKVVTGCVLATDLAVSMTWLSTARVVLLETNDNTDQATSVVTEKTKAENKLCRMKLAIKCGDVSHPSRPLEQHLEWSKRISEEFFLQGDLERSRGMSISPLCDRNVPPSTFPQSQIGFINFVAKPVFVLLSSVLSSVPDDEKPWMKYLKSNTQHWEKEKRNFLG
jgi:hypothetical protein